MADTGYRNRAYIFDEGDGGQPTDRRSNSSTSSVHRFIERNLKSRGKVRWAVILIGVVVGVVVIAAIAATVYFLLDNTKETRLKQAPDDSAGSSTLLPVAATTDVHITSPGVTTVTTAVIGTTKSNPASTQTVTTQRPTPTNPEMTVTSTAYTTPFNDISTPRNLTVSMPPIVYHVGDRTIRVICRGLHSGNWTTLTLRKQFKDGYEPIAVTMYTRNAASTVNVFTPHTTYALVEKTYELVLTADLHINCTDVTNYSCAFVADSGTVNQVADLTIHMPTPHVVVPHVVIENREVRLQCIVDTWDISANVVWEYRPVRSDRFIIFSVTPTSNKTQGDCLTTINSSLTFNASMHENGSDFRCKVVYTGGNVIRAQMSHKMADVHILVVSADFCEDKGHYTIHPHPHYPCSLVVYCLNDGPTVYEIECDPGECYDANSTKCVPQNR